ncbi:enhancer of polycomb [Culex quinquefasciatus]|uniref:Enhancer of polycomb n=1 Tax=Culex quinquefasciatus TaxID=7176 RepID=B0X7U3_CULQU|nr:enhancer of polycomb [Culex quinquefasciatus]|eukprot:XP_001865715.1 enhancer of polycomb [Culex quinquefasciatus]
MEHWKAVRSGSRRDLSRAVTLLEIIERREKTNREQLHLRIGVYEKRYQAQDFAALVSLSPAFASTRTSIRRTTGRCPAARSRRDVDQRVSVGRRRKFVGRDGSVLPGACDRYHHQYHLAGGSAGGQPLIGERGRIDPSAIAVTARFHGSGTAGDPALTSDKEELVNLEGATAPEEEYAYTVQPRKFSVWNWPWVSNEENGGQLLGHYAQHCIYMT